MVLDLALPDGHGLELIKDIRAQSGCPGILVYSLYEDSVYGLRVLRAGANGHLMKSEPVARAVEALRVIAAGQFAVSSAVLNKLLRRCAGFAQGGDGVSLAALNDRTPYPGVQVRAPAGGAAGLRAARCIPATCRAVERL